MKRLNPETKNIIYAMFLLLSVIVPAIPDLKMRIIDMPLVMAAYWCILMCTVSFVLPTLYIPGIDLSSKYFIGYSLSGGIIFIALEFVPALFMKKLGASPYDISPIGIFSNAVAIFPAIMAKEMVRRYSFASVFKALKHKKLAMAIITVIFCLAEINFKKIIDIKEFKELFIYIAQIVLPIITRNILMSVLAFYGGAMASIAYIGIIQLFLKCFPVLPELPWLIDSAIGVAFPIIYAMFMSEHVFETGRSSRVNKKEDVMYLLSFLTAIVFVWFCVGAFPIYPNIILTGSMEPLIYPGDVVIVKKIAKEDEIYDLSVGDIISFKRDDITITHRIKEILRDDAGNIKFETKGDNNNSVDERKVEPNDIKGIIIKVVPKIGLPALILRESDKIPEGVLDK